jgi:glycosyltransferase involved in cell wall biosynthesis
MNDPSVMIPTRLFTTFGTVLYVDEALGQLRHGSIEESPANLFFELDPKRGAPGRQGRLIHAEGGSRIPLVCDGESCRPATGANKDHAAQGTWLELMPLERGLIGFAAGVMFLAATPDGKVDLSRPWCSAWECFLASEDWCTDRAIIGEGPASPPAAVIDKRTIAKYGIDPVLRMKSRPRSRNMKILVYGYPQWSHGRVYYDVSKYLYERGYIVDIINWQADHSAHIEALLAYYDLVMTAPDGVGTLTDRWRVPYEKIIAVSHHEMDIRMLIEQKGMEVFDRFAAYGVVSYFVYCASLMRGVTRAPKIASVGITYEDFHAEIPERLATVGYASSMSVKTYGVEWKRGELAEAAAHQAGLAFRKAGSTGNQISFHDMPDFYRTVDAILTSSISEAAQLPVMEGAAAGRLVIGTPVGHFPLKAYQGGGIIAPVEAEKFTAFAAETLRYYKENPAAYVEKCRAIQEAARQFDWQNVIGEWVELIEEAKRHGSIG